MMVIWIFKHEMKQLLKDRVAAGLLIALPLLFIWLFSLALGPHLNSDRFASKFEIALVDQDDTPGSRMLAQQFETSDYVKGYVKVDHTSEGSALELLRQDRIAGIVLIPAGFIDSVYAGTNKPLTFIANANTRAESDLIKNELTGAADLVSAGQSGIITVWRYTKWGGADQTLADKQFSAAVSSFTLASLARNNVFRLETVSGLPDVTWLEYFTAGLLAVFASFLGLRGVSSFQAERTAGMAQRLQASPLRPWQMVLGKFLALSLLIMGQLVLVVLVTGVMFHNYLGGSLAGMAVISAATAFAASALSLLAASLFHSAQAASLAGYAGSLLLAFAGGNIYPLVDLPEGVRKLSSFVFDRWSMDGFLRVFAGETFMRIAPDALVLLSISGVTLALAAGGYRLTGRRIR